MRELTYGSAINEGLHQAMSLSKDVVVWGQLVDYKSGIFGTTTGLAEKFGVDRVVDFPVSEAAMTSMALGAATAGLRPVLVHQRLDFMIYSLDALVNWLSLWHFKSKGESTAPVTIRAIVGKGWGQGPQHSKSIHSWFAHLPGLRVAMPSNAFDAKGLLLESIFSEDPTVILENRSLFSMKSQVPENPYGVRFGEAAILRPGKDLSIVSVGNMVPSALRAAHQLSKEGIDAEVVDLRTITPLDRKAICQSVEKTGRLIAADQGWLTCGLAAEIIATATEGLRKPLLAPPVRICLPDSHTPMSQTLEEDYYVNSTDIIDAARKLFRN